jgi:hypothetical protein
MVMIENEDKFRQTLEALLDEEDQEHDGWAPVQPRRSSMPAPLSAAAASEDEPGVATESLTKPVNN